MSTELDDLVTTARRVTRDKLLKEIGLLTRI